MKDEIKKIWEKCGYDEDTKLYGEDAFNFLKDNNIESVEARYEDTSDYSEGYRVAFGYEEDLESANLFEPFEHFNCRLDVTKSDKGCLVFAEDQAYTGFVDGDRFQVDELCPTLVVYKKGYEGYLTISKDTYDNAWRVIHNLEENTPFWEEDYLGEQTHTIKAIHLPTGREFYRSDHKHGLEGLDYLIKLVYDLPALRSRESDWECEDIGFIGNLGDNIFNDCIFQTVKVED